MVYSKKTIVRCQKSLNVCREREYNDRRLTSPIADIAIQPDLITDLVWVGLRTAMTSKTLNHRTRPLWDS